MKTGLKVMLISHSPDAEKTISAAAKLCYSPSSIDEVVSGNNETDRRVFLKKLVSVGHLSPIEHSSFTFAIEGISRACSHQLVRHRLASYSQQSQRYVDEEEFDYIIPPSIESNKQLKTDFESLMNDIQERYAYIVERLNQIGYGVEEAREDARFILPNATETKIMVTMNARELLHFFSVRLCNRAQWEIREMALSMLHLVKPVAPVIFHQAGPPCLHGKCPEGPRTCGKAEEVRQRFNVGSL
jgi:thymidylate synthase (FAD)